MAGPGGSRPVEPLPARVAGRVRVVRIAVFVDRFPVLSETFVLNQITGLIDRGHDVDIVPARPGGDAVVHGDVERYGLRSRVLPLCPPALVRLQRAPRLFSRLVRLRGLGALAAVDAFRHGRDAWSLRLLYAAAVFADRGSYDVVLCHFGPNARFAQRLRDVGALRGPLAAVFHGWDLSQFLRRSGPRPYARLFARGDLFLPISARWAERLRELGCPSERTVVHHMGIDPNRFPFETRDLGPDEPVRVLSVARLVEKKGIEFGIRAVAAYLATPGARPLEYCIVGDGPLRADLARLIRDLRVSGHVTLVGHKSQEEVTRELQRAHVFVAPSVTGADGDEEGIPVVLMEALAVGLPVVSTRHSGIPELIEDGVSGVLVAEGDAEALADALARLVDNVGGWPAMAQRGRQRVEEDFNLHQLNDQLVSLMEGLC